VCEDAVPLVRMFHLSHRTKQSSPENTVKQAPFSHHSHTTQCHTHTNKKQATSALDQHHHEQTSTKAARALTSTSYTFSTHMHHHHHHHDDDEEQQQRPPEHHPLLLMQQEAALVDVGGEVEPRQTCPHVHLASHLHVSPHDLTASIPRGRCATCGSQREPWVCLGCNVVHCSRYVNADAEAHFFASLTAEPEEGRRGVGGGDSGEEGGGGTGHGAGGGGKGGGKEGEGHAGGEGHGLVLSLSDLSVWCYLCGGYVKHDRLLPFLVRAEALKFNTPDKTALLAEVQTRFQTGLVLPGGRDEAEEEKEGAADVKPTPAQRVFEHLKACSLLAKTVRVGSVAEALARGDLRSVLVFDEGMAGGKQEEEEMTGEGKGGEVVVVPPEQAKVREALGAGMDLVVVQMDVGGVWERPEGVEACLRLMLEAT